MTGLIKISEFVDYLQSNGLVIVSKTQLLNEDLLIQQRLERLQRELLAKPYVTFRQAIDARLVPVTSKQGIESMVVCGKFREGEVYYNKARRRVILTSALKRLRHES